MMSKAEVNTYVHSHLPSDIHMSLNLDKDTYTHQEADQILFQALETCEYIKKLRREEHGKEN